ncbi:MAG: hypothetical protein H6705_03380 [Myxococcales bacterium]|nr:hypothetical protein [Myxococcales bacterium]
MRRDVWLLVSSVFAVGLPAGGAVAGVVVGLPLIGPCRSGVIDVCLHNGCPGTRVCIGGLVSVCLPPVERCDGADDDCDGSVDEDFAGLGEACGVGVGACAREGAQVCDAAGEAVVCGAVAGMPSAEVCNGEDDDCDGAVDEGEGGGAITRGCYDGPAGTAGVGTCAEGVQRCVDGAFAACEGQVMPVDEVCDDVDDDCDGDPYGGCSSCALLRVLDPTAEDGEYRLPVGGDPAQEASIYCHDMAGEPREFLTLVEIGPDRNFSQYTAGGASPGTNVRTRFERVRVDLETLVVDGADYTFATSAGQLQHGSQPVTEMPYAAAMGCAFGSAVGAANVDLRGTPFAVMGSPCVAGFRTFGSTLWSALDQVVDITGGGYCGWASVAPNCGFAPQAGGEGFTLQLRYDAALAAP